MNAVWRWVSLRHLRDEWPRTLLTVAGVALGVSVFVSIRLASHSALASFSDTVDAVAGRANLQVSAGTEGFDERLYPIVRSLPGVRAAAPIVECVALARPGAPVPDRARVSGEPSPYDETLWVIGVDVFNEAPLARVIDRDHRMALRLSEFLRDPRAVVVTRTLAARYRLAVGDSLTLLASGRPVAFTVRGILETDELQHAFAGNVVMVDIATAQEVFGRVGRLDRIDVIADPAARDALRARIASLAPPGVEVDTPAGRTRQVENLVRAFDLNLTALSFIALFVASYLIFNAVSISVVRRRRELGILRAIGLSRARLTGLILGEGVVLGAAGTALGLALGTLWARATLLAVSRTLTDLYQIAHAATLRLDVATYVIAGGLGVVVAALAAAAPAWEAARTPPAEVMRQGAWIEVGRLRLARWTAAGLVLLCAAALTALWTVAERRPLGGFAAAFLLLAGFSLLAPGFARAGEALAAPVLARVVGVEGWLGARYLREALARTSVVVAALMVAVGMLVGLTVMVRSFRSTVDTWITQSVRGDLYVEPVGMRVSGGVASLPEPFVTAVRQVPGVLAVDSYRGVRIRHDGRPTFVAGIDFAVQRRHGRLTFVSGENPDVLGQALAQDAAIVTESFAHHHRVAAGDTIALATPSGLARVPVAGVFYDYSTDAGAVVLDRSRFAELWNDRRTESLALYLAPGADADQVRRRIVAAAGTELLLRVTPNRALRERVLTVFDQTFQITYALQAIAVLVAMLGVVSTLTALILQRGAEIGVLRATGALRRQIHRMVLVESGLIGLLGGVLGGACGLALAVLLAHVINRQFFGWTIRLVIEPGVVFQAVALAFGAALIAGLWPARLAAGREPAEAMRVE
ncbi:MAG TPA: FtsX-like permease family protein [Candidatus Limnocylindria bacterium]|nr:FtsX-like permease family protein [Candidatus Limnocylindria bacterium]